MIVPNKKIILPIVTSSLAFILKTLLPTDYKISIFLILCFAMVIVLLYWVYSFFELRVFHERQGSKLDLTKNKLSTSVWD